MISEGLRRIAGVDFAMIRTETQRMTDAGDPMDAIEFDLVDPEVQGEPTEIWWEFGTWLGGQRVALGLTKRQAATLAGISASTWSTLEKGGRTVRGEWVEPSPEDTTLVRIAKAMRADPFDVFEMVGRRWVEALDPVQLPEGDAPGGDYNTKIARVSTATKQAIDDLIAAEVRRQRS